MKRILLALAIMTMTLCVGAQTTKKRTTKKATTTATTKKRTAASKSKTTAKKTYTATKKTTTTTTTTTATTSQPRENVKEQRHETTYNNPKHERHIANKGWNEVYNFIGGAFVTAKESDNEDGDIAKISGSCFQFSTGFSHAFPVSQNLPIYVRPGVDITFAAGSKNLLDFDNIEDEISHMSSSKQMKELYDMSVVTLSASINVDCGYKIPIAGGKLSVMPYIGGQLKINALGKATRGGESYDLFNDKELEDLLMTETDKGAKRIQAGLRIGADVYAIRHLVVGLQLQLHTPYCSYKFTEDDYSSTFKITETSLGLKAGFVW